MTNFSVVKNFNSLSKVDLKNSTKNISVFKRLKDFKWPKYKPLKAHTQYIMFKTNL